MRTSGDFVQNVMNALKNEGTNGALRLDILADTLLPLRADGSHRWEVYDKVKLMVQMEEQGLGEFPFELISAREQEGYGFPQDSFPREKMGERPGVRKRTRKARAAVENATGQAEPKTQVNYWPIVAIKDPARASMKKDLGDIADFLHSYIADNYGGRFDVILSGKSLTVKFGGVGSDNESEDEDESVDG